MNNDHSERGGNNAKNLSEIPAAACTLVVGEFAIGDNGEDAKSAPVSLVARSGQPIEHWFWGRVVHDLAGMHMHKSRLPIDYVHDSKEILGYLNHFETESGDLVTSGALVPFKDSDRATEIMHKMRAGVPYEASINFGGDGIKVQEVGDGEVTEVNGYQFDGPGCIVREWPLRGVAVCPYGADMNTESAAAFEGNKVFSASVVTEPEADTKEDSEMSESVDVEAKVDAPEAELENEQTESVEDANAEASESTEEVLSEEAVDAESASEETETEAADDSEAANMEQAESTEELADDEPESFDRAEFVRISDEFGADIACQTVREGGDYEAALALSNEALKAENAALKERNEELTAKSGKVFGGEAAKVTEATEKKSLFKTQK